MKDTDTVIKRVYARGEWVLLSPAHFGCPSETEVDMVLIRDQDGEPFIPGTSIAGAARHYLFYRYGRNDDLARQLFGGSGREDQMSKVIVRDARICTSARSRTLLRDGVSICPKTGTAIDTKKYDLEVIDTGTRFLMQLEFVLHQGDDRALEGYFYGLLHALALGEMQLGARTRRGYGRGQVDNWDIRVLSMNKLSHVAAWLTDQPWDVEDAQVALSERVVKLADHRAWFKATLDLHLKTSLLVRSYVESPGAPDMVHVHADQKPVLPGTSIAGALRNRAVRIVNTQGWPMKLVDDLFGPLEGEEESLWASRLLVEEVPLENVAPMVQGRVAIDRFTGGALSGALFDEAAVWPTGPGPHFILKLTIEEPREPEIGLLLLVLKDLYVGDLPIGGEVGIGRGVVMGTKAELKRRFSDGRESVWSWESPLGEPEKVVPGPGQDLDELSYLVLELVENYGQGGCA
ncbi:MAG: RAMP superfamily CRISPR-associated protein [Limnochordia bacterium]|nr:RAMP superfamily CRISPR-associated protein [Limnochordia bacterium]